jgi:hypothetical protein
LFPNNIFLDNYYNNINLSIDPFNINTYVIDKYFPNHNLDISYYSLRVDGSTFIPLAQSMPHRLYFDYNTKDDFTQLIYSQNKADSFFDTDISMKNNVSKDVDFLLQVESKSLVENINQNLFFNYAKNSAFFDLNFSYMYHYESDPENLKFINSDNDYYKSIESYNTGFSIKYINKNIVFISDISNQISSNNRPEMNGQIYYDSNVFWNNNLLSLSFNSKSSIYIENRYKKNIIEFEGNIDNFLNQNVATFGYSYNDNKFQLDIGVNHLDKRVFPLFSTSYNADMFSIKFSVDNQYLNNFIDSETEGIFGENISYLATRTNLNSYFKLDYIENTIDIGNISYDDYEYNYLLLNGEVLLKKITLNYKHFKYFGINETSVPFNQHSNLSVSFYPFKESYEFELYGKFSVDLFSMDSGMDLTKLNPFNYENIEYRDITSCNGEIGIIFDSFIISYKSNNILDDQITYSNLINSFQRYDYLNVIWTFKE